VKLGKIACCEASRLNGGRRGEKKEKSSTVEHRRVIWLKRRKLLSNGASVRDLGKGGLRLHL